LIESLHCLEALEQIFVCASPAVVNRHWVVGCDRAINEGPVRSTSAKAPQLLKGVSVFPELQYFVLLLYKVYLSRYRFEHIILPVLALIETLYAMNVVVFAYLIAGWEDHPRRSALRHLLLHLLVVQYGNESAHLFLCT
jgi:hypothetical protein